MKEAKQSLTRLIIGIWICMIPVSVLGLVLTAGQIGFLFGELIGCVLATAMALHIYHTLDVALDLDPEHAARHAKSGSVVRSMITIVILAIGFWLRHWINPIGIFTGMMGLKLSVYLMPVYDKIRRRKE